MTNKQFIEEIYELAFGDNAINKKYSHKQVIKKIKKFNDNALKYEMILEENPEIVDAINEEMESYYD